MTTLDILYSARATLSDLDVSYHFMDWTRCTCGHIYQAARGKRAEHTYLPMQSKEELYVAALDAIVETFPEESEKLLRQIDTDSDCHNATAVLVSHLTYSTALAFSLGCVSKRDCALKMVETTIQRLESEQAQARLDVLDQLDFVPELVESEPVPA